MTFYVGDNMELVEVFQILGIEQTKDEKSLKNAYRNKLSVTNPEDDPEGFKRLRAAYEEACLYAKTPDEEQQGNVTTASFEDDTPAGQWVRTAREIYENITDRCDVTKWRKLFEEDAFLSLEEEENCTTYLLRFLMEHFKLPTDVWKLLDEKIHIVKNAGAFRERFPAQFVNYMVHKCEAGEEVDFTRFTGAEDADYDQFLQYYDRAFQALQGNDMEEAKHMLDCGDALGITHPVMEVCRASYYEKKGQIQEAIALLKELSARYPEDDLIAYHTAEILWRNVAKDEAATIYEKLLKKLPKHYMANLRLTTWYYEQERYKEAKKCAEEVLSVGGDDTFLDTLQKINSELEKEMEREYAETGDPGLGLDLGWCYLQDGRTNRGIRTVRELEEIVPKDRAEEYLGLMTKLHAEAAEYEKTIELAARWEESLEKKVLRDTDPAEEEKDKDRIRQSHLIRMQCYRAYGYVQPEKFAKAIEEAEKAQTGTPKDIGMLIEKAQIYVEMEEYERCAEISRSLIEDYQVYAAYANELEAAKRQWNAAGVIQNGRACLNYFPEYVKAYEMMAKVYLDLKHPEELKQLLQEAKEHNVKSVILDAYEWQMTNTPMKQEQMNEAIDKFQEEYLRNVVAGKQIYYERGLPVITEYLYAYPCEYLLMERGDFHKAAGHLEEAKADYEKIFSTNPAHPFAWKALAQIHRYRGLYNEAASCLQKAYFFYGKGGTEEVNWPELVAERADVYLLLGDPGKAEENYREFLKKTGDAGAKDAERMRSYARCLAEQGRLTESFDVLDRAFPDVLKASREKADLCIDCGEGETAKEILEKWQEQIKLVGAGNGNTQKYYEDYHYSLGWYELLYGSGAKAVDYFEQSAVHRIQKIQSRGVLADLIFACILTGNENKGTTYSEHLKYWLDRDKRYGSDYYRDMPKLQLVYRYLEAYYTGTREELDAILAENADCMFCRHCTYGVCKEILEIQLLNLLHKGQKEELKKRIELAKKNAASEYVKAFDRFLEELLQPAEQKVTQKDKPKKQGFFAKLFQH